MFPPNKVAIKKTFRGPYLPAAHCGQILSLAHPLKLPSERLCCNSNDIYTDSSTLHPNEAPAWPTGSVCLQRCFATNPQNKNPSRVSSSPLSFSINSKLVTIKLCFVFNPPTFLLTGRKANGTWSISSKLFSYFFPHQHKSSSV